MNQILIQNLEAISKFIKDVGFPIIAFLMMFWLCTTVMEDNTTAIEGLTVAIENMGRS